MIPYLLYLVSLSGFVIAEDNSGMITIYVHNTALSPNHVQVRDDVCTGDLPYECKFADIIYQKCKRNKKTKQSGQEEELREECDEAKSTVESSHCIEGIIYDGFLQSKEKVRLSICDTGNVSGDISVRTINNTSSWTRKFWVRDGDIVDHQ